MRALGMIFLRVTDTEASTLHIEKALQQSRGDLGVAANLSDSVLAVLIASHR